jgi:hypothetical protein
MIVSYSAQMHMFQAELNIQRSSNISVTVVAAVNIRQRMATHLQVAQNDNRVKNTGFP